MKWNSYLQILFAALFFSQTVFAQVSTAVTVAEKVAQKAASGAKKVWNKTDFQDVEFVEVGSKAGMKLLPNYTKKGNNVVRTLKNVAKFGGTTFLHFVPEAFAFFVALGALRYGQLFMDFSENPVSMEQHLNGHDPTTAEGRLGYISFYAFMLGNRGCNSLLDPMTGSRTKMRGFVPYLGMACGFTASNIVHEIASFGDLKKCVASLEARIQDEEKYKACEKAYDSWSEVGTEKMEQYAPTLMAMATSTLTAGLASMPMRKAMVSMGLEIVLLATPAGWNIKIARGVWKVGELILFTYLQEAQEPVLTRLFQNVADGMQITNSQQGLISELDLKKRNGWRPIAEDSRYQGYDLDLQIRKFSERAKEWRKGNMVDILNSHAAWQQFLMKFSGTYKAAMEFDAFYIGEYKKKFQDKQDNYLDAPLYLAGVKPKEPGDEIAGGEAPASDAEAELAKIEAEQAKQNSGESTSALNLLNNRRDYEYRQIEHLIDVREYYEKEIQKIPAATRQQFSQYYADALEVLQYLPTRSDWEAKKLDYPKIAKGLDLLNAKLQLNNPYPTMTPMPKNYPEGRFAPADSRDLLSQIRAEIGEPWPLYQPGTGFIYAYTEDPMKLKSLEGLQAPKTWERIRLNNPVHYLVTQLLSGPRADLNQSVLKESLGFPAEFLPPRLVHSFRYQVFDGLAKSPFKVASSSPQPGTPTIFNTPMSVISTKTVSFPNAFEILRGSNVLPSILNEKDGFMAWWNKNVESKYIQAWTKYENEYQKLMVKMLERYRFEDKEAWSWSNWWDRLKNVVRGGMNIGPMSNGLRQSMLQERRLYLLILGELLRDYKKLLGENLPLYKVGIKDPAFSAGQFPVGTNCENFPLKNTKPMEYGHLGCPKNAGNHAPYLPILEILGAGDYFNLSRIYKAYQDPFLKSYGTENGDAHFAFQDQITNEFNALEALMDQMKITSVADGTVGLQVGDKVLSFELAKKVVVTTVTNKQLTEARDKIQKTVEDLQTELKTKLAPLNSHAYDIALACLVGLRNLAQQQADIGKIINAVSYTRSVDKTDTSGRSGLCEEMSLTAIRKTAMGQTIQRKGCDAGTRIEAKANE